MFNAQANEILGAMITPAVLISASGTLVLSTGNRLGRVVDRVRVLTEEAEKMVADPTHHGVDSDEKRGLILTQLSQLATRIQLLAQTITILYLTIGLFIATSIGIGVDSFFGSHLSYVPVCSGLAGASMMLYSSMLLVREAKLAITSTLHEMSYVRGIVARNTPKESREQRAMDARP